MIICAVTKLQMLYDNAPAPQIGMPYALWGLAYILLASLYLLAGSSFEDTSSPVLGLSVPREAASPLLNRTRLLTRGCASSMACSWRPLGARRCRLLDIYQ